MTDAETAPDPAAINAIFHLYDPPLWLVTATQAGRRGGLIATSVVRASIVAALPRILIAVARHHHTWSLIDGSGRFALHLLPETDVAAVWRFGLRSGREADKFVGLPDLSTPDGNPRYPGCAAWLDCRVEDRLEIGDRTVFAAAITGGAACGAGPVLGVAALLRAAPPAERAELDRRYAADAALDASSIRRWRCTKGIEVTGRP